MPSYRWIVLILTIDLALGLTPRAVAQHTPLTDLYGDPLPSGASTRLGTVRFRNSNKCESLAYTPDGRFVVCGGVGGVVVWEAATGKEVRRLGTELPDPGGAASLSTDGKFVAVGGGTGEGKEPGGAVYEVASGRLVYRFGTDSGATLARFSPDGTVLATYGSSLRIELHDAATGKPLRRLEGHRNGNPIGSNLVIVNVLFTPHSKMLISAGVDGTIRVWNVATGKQQIEMIGGSASMDRIGLSPDGALLASQAWLDITEPKVKGMGSSHYTLEPRIFLWDPVTGQKIRQLQPPAGQTEEEPSVGRLLGFAPDGKSLVTASFRIQAWDPQTGKFLRYLTEDGTAATIAFAPDGKAFAGFDWGRALKLYDCGTGRALVQSDGHRDAIDALAVSPDGQIVASAGSDRAVLLWDVKTGKQVRRLTDTEGHPAALMFSPNGQDLFSTIRGRLLAWDPQAVREPRRVLGPDAGPSRVVFSHDGKLLACLARNGKAILLLDAATGKELRNLPGPVEQITDIAFARDDRTFLALAPKGKNLITWDTATGERREKRIASLSEECAIVAISPDGRLAAFATNSGPLVLIDLATDKEVCRIASERFGIRTAFPIFGFPQRLMHFSPDGRTLAWTVQKEQTVCLSEIATGKERRRLAGHRGNVTTLAFSGTGALLVTGSDDTTCLAWDLNGPAGWAEPPGPLSDAALAACWDDLRSDDAARAHLALRRLLAEPARTLPFLGSRLRPIAAPDKKHVARLLADLDSDEFEKRDAARRELERLGDVVLPALRQVTGGTSSLEMRRRVQQLIDLHETLRSETLRTVRAVEALEFLGTPQAQQLLEALAKGAAGTRQTREAQESLDRLATRPAVAGG